MMRLYILCKRTNKIFSMAVVSHEGIIGGEIVDRKKLVKAIEKVMIKSSARNLGVREIYIVVPHTFCTCKTKEIVTEFASKTRLRPEILKKADDFHEGLEGYIVQSSDLYHLLDGERAVTDVRSYMASQVVTMHSVLLCDIDFVEIMQEGLAGQFSFVKYIPQSLAESLYILSDEVRDKTSTLIDISGFETTIIVVCGDGILHKASIPIGTSNILDDLCIVKKLDYDSGLAVILCDKACLSVECDCDEVYEIELIVGWDKNTEKKEVRAFNKQEINAIISARLEEIAIEVLREIKLFDEKLLCDNHPMFLNRGFIRVIKGAKSLIERIIGRELEDAIDPLKAVPVSDETILSGVKKFIKTM